MNIYYDYRKQVAKLLAQGWVEVKHKGRVTRLQPPGDFDPTHVEFVKAGKNLVIPKEIKL